MPLRRVPFRTIFAYAANAVADAVSRRWVTARRFPALPPALALTMTLALAGLLSATAASGQDEWNQTGVWSGTEPVSESWTAEGPPSLKGRGTIRMGGEAFVDLGYKSRDRARRIDPASGLPELSDGRQSRTSFEATTANLRFQVQPTTLDNAMLFIKLSLNDAWNDNGQIKQDDLLEECRFVFDNILGGGWSVMFGKGEVPFGQDRTLGIIQSYAHNADAYNSSEGPLSLLADPAWYSGAAGRPVGRSGDGDRLARPGEIDRTFFVGAAYRWRDRLKGEIALFQSDRRISGRHSSDGMQSLALRLWWTPLENLTLQISGMRRHSDYWGDGANRGAGSGRELANPNDAREGEYALSVGAEWTPGPWEVWGEYLRGWNWNNTDDYTTDMIGLGARYNFSERWSAGGMFEWLRLRDPNNGLRREDYYKAVASVKYTMPSGMFLIGELGHEWFRGHYQGMRDAKARALMLAMRAGWQF